ncbi:hypothetical protein J5U21_01470 [Saccharolobus shibatae]|uniref:Uncharacterized protein n=1 Tax=Saccharolobus shibatae TaxID=2286 RepID=A0A8F5BUN8_9CREN|nr:hypothetical protein J5U21_01470 [Saccharolobus shibatae]
MKCNNRPKLAKPNRDLTSSTLKIIYSIPHNTFPQRTPQGLRLGEPT